MGWCRGVWEVGWGWGGRWDGVWCEARQIKKKDDFENFSLISCEGKGCRLG